MEEAIAMKRDAKVMRDTYHPPSVEQYWDRWWQERYKMLDLVNFSTLGMAPTKRNSRFVCLLRTLQDIFILDMP